MSIGAYLSSKAEQDQEEAKQKNNVTLKSPFAIGLATYISFIFIGLIPLSVYLLNVFTKNIEHLFFWTSIFTFFGFALIGFLKSLITQKSKFISILETVFLGALAA